jgi:hypothetical protein
MAYLKQRTSQERKKQRGAGGAGGLRDLAAMGWSWTPWLVVPLYIGGRFIPPQSNPILSYSNLTLLKEDTGRIAEQTLRGGGRCVAGRGDQEGRSNVGVDRLVGQREACGNGMKEQRVAEMGEPVRTTLDVLGGSGQPSGKGGGK